MKQPFPVIGLRLSAHTLAVSAASSQRGSVADDRERRDGDEERYKQPRGRGLRPVICLQTGRDVAVQSAFSSSVKWQERLRATTTLDSPETPSFLLQEAIIYLRLAWGSYCSV